MRSSKLLQKVVEIIKQTIAPRQIILFGSSVMGKEHKHSDLDLLIVIENHQHRRRAAQAVYKNLVGIGFAVDLLVVTEADVQQYKDNPGLIIHSALKEGRQIYAA